ncbi:preprotein translocase subunit SecA [Thiomicrospira microaerophila]|uniref:preprotein translocase subunit SecA n=1 Tax=Thiomicrospira microaerophila TaxID=406020 RepID=UPI0009FC8B93|nr:hypothetical protein [Thiomicrospira microaerophila]
MDAFYYSEPKPIPPMPFAIWSKLQVGWFALFKGRVLARYWRDIHQINAMHNACLSRWKTPGAFEQDLAQVKSLARKHKLAEHPEQLYLALNILRHLSQQSLGMAPYDVQLISLLAMFEGHMVQLAPGEGKTLTIAMLAIMQAWLEKPCHVITANDYLAQRDAQLMQPLFVACGVSAIAVNQEMAPEEKKAAYQAPIVYSTAKQLLADFLHDKIQFGGSPSRLGLSLSALKSTLPEFYMRGLYSVVVDEADSILIDDATTPLIISMPERNELLKQAVMIAKDIADLLQPKRHYKLDTENNDLKFTKLGEQLLEAHTDSLPRLWHSKDRRHDLMYQAIMARDHFKLDQHYVIEEGKVVIVDESTGRTMPGRSWSYGLHQSVEARAGVELTDPSKTLEKMSFQNFFKHYHHLTGASGTLQNIHQELYHNYKVQVMSVPPRKKSQLKVQGFRVFTSQAKKWHALIEQVKAFHQQGLPVLIGTKRISDSEKLAEMLAAEQLNFDVLNAKQLAREADIIAQAGEAGRITVATNMAGRGTDIKVPDEVLAQGGLKVLMLEPHESARIDWQLFGRSGRQGHPGEAIPFVAADDSLFSEHLAWWHKPILLLAIGLPFLRKGLMKQLVSTAQQRAQNKAFRRRRLLNKIVKDAKARLSFVRSTG